MENDALESLIKLENSYRQKGNYNECLDLCIEIIKKIQTSSSSNQKDILTKVLVNKNQSLYVILGSFRYILMKSPFPTLESKELNSIIKSSLLKSKDQAKYLNEKNQLLNLFSKNKEVNTSEILKILPLNNIIEDKYLKIKSINKTPSVIQSEHSLDYQLTSLNLTSSSNFDEIETNNPLPIIEKKSTQNELLSKTNNNKQMIEINKKYKPNMTLPYILFDFSATLSNKQIHSLITLLFEKIKYKKLICIKETDNELINIYEHLPNKCLCFCKNGTKSKFHFNILYNNDLILKEKYERKIYLRTINGDSKKMHKRIMKFLLLLSEFIIKFKVIKISKDFNKYETEECIGAVIEKKKNELLKKQKIPKQIEVEINFNNSLDDNYKNLNNQNANLIDIDNTSNSQGNRVNTQLYDIYKMLSQNDYDLGKLVNNFISLFKQQFNEVINSIETIKTKEIMQKIVKVIDDSVIIFNNSFNINSINTINSTYLREATENYLLNKIYPLLIQIYKAKNKEKNAKFINKKNEINSKMNIEQIFNHLEIKNKFKGDDKVPYKISIESINRIQYEYSPKKKFEIITNANLEMRNYILNLFKGKGDINSMDEELPITIYITTQTNVDNLLAELFIIDDYLKCTVKDDLVQNKMVINLISSIYYIIDSWDEPNN